MSKLEPQAAANEVATPIRHPSLPAPNLRSYPDYGFGWAQDDYGDVWDGDHEVLDPADLARWKADIERWKTDPAYWQAVLDHDTEDRRQTRQQIDEHEAFKRDEIHHDADGTVWLGRRREDEDIKWWKLRLHEETVGAQALAALVRLHELGAPEPKPEGLR